MGYTNSGLVDFKWLSPNHSGQREHAIDRISPHCVVGQCSAESLGEWFSQTSTQASSNYGIDKDGRIGLYVEEKNRSWCTSSNANDQRAVTIECASDLQEPYWMNEKVYASLVKLCTDICKRNGNNGVYMSFDSVCEVTQEVIKHCIIDLMEAPKIDIGKKLEEIESRIKNAEKELQSIPAELSDLYADAKEGLLDESEYQDMKARVLRKKADYEKQIAEGNEEKKMVEESAKRAPKDKLERFLKEEFMTREMVELFVETIWIHKNRSIEVQLCSTAEIISKLEAI